MSNDIGLLDTVERAISDNLSRQPRFIPGDAGRLAFFNTVTEFMRKFSERELKLPSYRPGSIKRDSELRKLWKLEPHWAGVVNQTVLIDSSRGWTITGGRNQVMRYVAILHDADDGKGWRSFMRRASLGYRVTDMGALIELGREVAGGPVRAFYNLDSARCQWSGNPELPLNYWPGTGGLQSWPQEEFISVVSMPSDDESFNGLGYCATSRAFDIIKILYGVLMHDQEMIGARMPKGIMLLSNIDESDWEDALDAREEDRTAKERDYFGGVMILGNMGTDAADIKLVALSQLPTNFDREIFIDQCIQGYALVSGYDTSEFWPVSSGALGRGKETEIQHKRAASKGVMEFPNGLEEGLNSPDVLPPTLHFEFEERDDEGELLRAQVAQAWADVAKTLTETTGLTGVPLLNQLQGLSFLVDQGVLPPEITEFEEDSQADDIDQTRLKRIRRRMIEIPQVRQAVEAFPNEPIIQYTWGLGGSKERVIWDSGADAMRPQAWAGFKARQDDDILFEDTETGVIITEADVDRAIEQGGRRVGPEFVELLTAETVE